MSGLAWYVVQSQPRKELLVRTQIEDLGREVYFPLYTRRLPGRRADREGPLFPSYLFAKLSETEGDIPRVRWTQGVRRILGDRERVRPVHDSVVEGLRARTDPRGRVRLGFGLRRGQTVRIVSGPLAGLVGVLDRCASDPQQRVQVLLEMFRRAIAVEIRASAVQGLEGH